MEYNMFGGVPATDGGAGGITLIFLLAFCALMWFYANHC